MASFISIFYVLLLKHNYEKYIKRFRFTCGISNVNGFRYIRFINDKINSVLIEVNYNPKNKACSTLAHFEEYFIHNDNLHYKLKEMPYTLVESDIDQIYLLDDNYEIVESFGALRLDLLSTYLLGE